MRGSRVLVSRLGLKSDQNGIEISKYNEETGVFQGLKSDQNGIEMLMEELLLKLGVG